MGGPVDKLFLPLAGLPVVGHTWRRLDAATCVDEVRWVIRPGMEDNFLALTLGDWTPVKPWQWVHGGQERQDSVWNGLDSLPASIEWVVIHDGARPCVSQDLIQRCLQAARECGASVAAQPAVDTIKESLDGQTISRHLDRSRLWAVQTPQCFRVSVLRAALQAVREQGALVSDDTAACEWIGQEVRLVESLEPNPKVTTQADCRWVEYLLKTQSAAH
jgi:2-C-methyl-D-erythritol 4-phosphate cytidylyltransferase